jgi:hypothetical protein
MITKCSHKKIKILEKLFNFECDLILAWKKQRRKFTQAVMTEEDFKKFLDFVLISFT